MGVILTTYSTSRDDPPNNHLLTSMSNQGEKVGRVYHRKTSDQPAKYQIFGGWEWDSMQSKPYPNTLPILVLVILFSALFLRCFRQHPQMISVATQTDDVPSHVGTVYFSRGGKCFHLSSQCPLNGSHVAISELRRCRNCGWFSVEVWVRHVSYTLSGLWHAVLHLRCGWLWFTLVHCCWHMPVFEMMCQFALSYLMHFIYWYPCGIRFTFTSTLTKQIVPSCKLT